MTLRCAHPNSGTTTPVLILAFALSHLVSLGSASAHDHMASVAASRPDANILVDGALNPELIPDDRAYHLVLLAGAATDDESDTDKARAVAVGESIFGTDRMAAATFRQLATSYKQSLDHLGLDQSPSSRRDELVALTKREMLSRLPANAGDSLEQYVRREKRYITLHEIPAMVARNGWRDHLNQWLGRLIPSTTVYAQMPVPSGATYRNISRTKATLYVTGVTDTTASCSCHRSSVSVEINAPAGSASNSTGLVGEKAQTTASYTLQGIDYTSGNDIRIISVHYSWCPYGGPFINNFTGSEWVPLKSIRAYYKYKGLDVYGRCNPTGGICDNVIEVNFKDRPAFALLDAVQIDIRAVQACVAKLASVVSKCYTPDPKP